MNVAVERAGRGWKVRVTPDQGPEVVYRYTSEAQARFFAAVVQLGPAELPETNRIKERAKRAPGTSRPGRRRTIALDAEATAL